MEHGERAMGSGPLESDFVHSGLEVLSCRHQIPTQGEKSDIIINNGVDDSPKTPGDHMKDWGEHQ